MRKSVAIRSMAGLSVIVAILLLNPFQTVAESKTYTNSIGMEFVLIQPGEFLMGSHEFENGATDEKPRHEVKITKPFYMGKYEVTQEQWLAVMGENSSHFQDPEKPVENISWEDAQDFINKLNRKEGVNKYRLPTEAEWEYAARAGSETAYCFGEDQDGVLLPQYAWYGENSNGETQSVGKLKPNAWGLYDMHGNVYEWCQDWYGKKQYSDHSATDPSGPSSGDARVLRGGCWDCTAGLCRSAARNLNTPDYQYKNRGFRLALNPETP